MLNKIKLMQPKWKRFASETHTWKGDKDTHRAWQQMEETLFSTIRSLQSWPVSRAVSYYHLKDWNRSFEELRLCGSLPWL